ncbi:MAG: tetratricopeptide repeat protein [Bacteroidetes bacterium]|nr:tetratricopeptide repeat protein [Bacteroidota bacterium]
MTRLICVECGQPRLPESDRCSGCGRESISHEEGQAGSASRELAFPSSWPSGILLLVIAGVLAGVVLTSMTVHDHSSHSQVSGEPVAEAVQTAPDLSRETMHFQALNAKTEKFEYASRIADSLNHLGQPALAAAWLEKAWQTDSTDAGLALRIANIWFDAGIKKMAVPYYRSFLNRFPDQANARVDYATALMEAGEVMQAVTELKRVLERNPTHQVANLNLGILNLQIGRPDQALMYFETARKADPVSQAGIRAAEMKSLIKTQTN